MTNFVPKKFPPIYPASRFKPFLFTAEGGGRSPLQLEEPISTRGRIERAIKSSGHGARGKRRRRRGRRKEGSGVGRKESEERYLAVSPLKQDSWQETRERERGREAEEGRG